MIKAFCAGSIVLAMTGVVLAGEQVPSFCTKSG